MGWYLDSRWQSAKDVRDELNEVASHGRNTIVAQKATNIGRHLWTLYRTPEGKGIITLHLIEQHDGCWGYKPMDEGMGPYYWDCPLSIIDAAGEPFNDTARQWRQAVRELAAKKARKFASGDRVCLYGKAYTFCGADTVRDDAGNLYRVKRSQIADCEPVA